jgi:hypothetical protein
MGRDWTEPPAGLLFISQMTDEHGQPWCNDIVKLSPYRHAGSYSFLTSALNRGVISVTLQPRFTPGSVVSVPIGQEAGWAQSWSGHRG